MKTMTRLLVIILCLIAAIGCYAVGFRVGSIAFFVLGVIFEGCFWLGLFPGNKSSKSSD